ncbi:hypothetical protein ABZO31_00515 [Streptomyces sp. HUAS MG47]
MLTDADPVHAAYLTVLDLFSINDPALEESSTRLVLQLLSGLVGLALLPLLVAGALEALGTFRAAGALRRPPRGLSGPIVLLGLGKIGTRVLARLHELDVPAVCVEEAPEARGIPLARGLGRCDNRDLTPLVSVRGGGSGQLSAVPVLGSGKRLLWCG